MKQKHTMKIVNLLLVLAISLAIPVQSVSATVMAAGTTTSESGSASSSTSTDSTTASDESIDTWMPDKNLQKLVYSALHDWGSSHDDYGGHETTSISQITPAMMADILFLNLAKDDTHVNGITDLTGLQNATGLKQFDFSGSTIEKAPGDGTNRDWSVFANSTSSELGTIDATSKDINLKNLTTLDTSHISFTLTSSSDSIAMPNMEKTGSDTGIQVTSLIANQNITYDPDLSTMKAYIPLSNWHKGFMTASGDYTYSTLTTGLADSISGMKGLTYDQENHRLVVDLNVWGGRELSIPSFDIKDIMANTQLSSGEALYYSNGNTLDATVPMASTPVDHAQTAPVPNRTDRTGNIDTTDFGFDSAADTNLTIKSGDLSAGDISFAPNLSNNQIKFTLSASALERLKAGDLQSDVMISNGSKIVDLKLTLTEPLDTWMPDKALQTQVQAALTADNLDGLTKVNLAKLTTPLSLTGVNNLTGLEYATKLGDLKMTGSNDLATFKAVNSQVLSTLPLTNLEIDDSNLGGSLAGWGLEKNTTLTNLTAQNDALTDAAPTEYANAQGLQTLDLSNNALTGEGSQFPMTSWSHLTKLDLSNNQLTGSLPDLTKNSVITEVNLENNKLDAIPESYGQQPALTTLKLDHNELSGEIPATLGQDGALQLLYLNNNQLTGTIPSTLGQLKQLVGLQLNDNQLTGDLPTALGQDTALTGLYLQNNQLTGAIPTEWSALKSLENMDLSSNKLVGYLTGIKTLTNLQTIGLSNNGFTGSVPGAWCTPKLTSLQASHNDLSGALPDELSTATNLASLDVSYNQLTGDLPDLTKATNLTILAYGANHITSGRTVSSAGGNYQTWSIADPDWQTSSDSKTMTLDLSKYYGGEQGQSGYQYLGMTLPSGEKGVTLDKSDPNHPLLTIDLATATVGKRFTVDLFDQAGKQAEVGGDGTTLMNYMATVTVLLAKTAQINTGDQDSIDFGTHTVGSGTVSANNFSLGVSSTGAAGDSYQLTAQTSGLTMGDQKLPIYYGSGQHQILLNEAAQNIYDYQPTTDEDTTTIGGSSGSIKNNLQTTIGKTTYAGKYTGQITYTLASAPANDAATAAKASDAGQVTSTTLSQLSTPLPATALSAEQEATRAKLETNMTSFVQNQLADSDGVLYSGYKAAHDATGSREELSETNGMWLLSLAMAGDDKTFDSAFSGITKRFYDSSTQTFNWQAKGDDHTVTPGSASVDDLRIIQALMVMNQKKPNNDRTAWINVLVDGFAKHDLNPYYQMIDGYNAAGQEKTIRLDYLDLATLKAVYEAKGLGTAGDKAYNDQLKLIQDSYISDQFPLYATFYDYATNSYQATDENGQVNITDGLITMLNLARVYELPQASLNWLKLHTANRTLYNTYDTDGTPTKGASDAPSNYAYVAQIAAAAGDTDLYNQALTVLKSMTSDEDSASSPLTPSDPLYGSSQYGGESYGFNDLNMLIAYASVLAGN
ncbi:hypothetical protein [Levilactobacillus huananensis]|uniref:hypothetical protein n=1 Tax=Levilactobacillus huananensis TaxID=2486019 RepID=UPI000F781400|nr:hypothetical protein [Levilactobacillus huananensis]